MNMIADSAVAVKPLVEVHELSKTFDVSAPWLNRVVERKPRQFVHAVDGVSFAIERGKTLALVRHCGHFQVRQRAGLAAAHADDFSGSVCEPEPALEGRRHRR
jgi:ABC-type antimicrobial peptide transport system ATPase subunit